MIKKIAAHYIFPICDKPIKNGVITYDETGKIIEHSQILNKLKRAIGDFQIQIILQFHQFIIAQFS